MQGNIRTRRTVSSEPLLVDPEIEKTARRNNSDTRRQRALSQQAAPQSSFPFNNQVIESFDSSSVNGMAGAGPPPRRTIGDSITYTSPRNFSSIVRPTMSDKLAEMKPALLQLISSNQFSGLDNEDPHAHLVTFYELCGTMGVQGEDEEALYM
ncbi:hypothetical protein VIGAN_04123300, partial [Vigna angularis var. angularis]